MKYALIGERLGHSFSVPVHRAFGLDYELKELPRGSLSEFVRACPYDGFNVTIPYKTEIMPLLTEIHSRAKKIGSVNTVAVRGKTLCGYNTDIDGMKYLLDSVGISLREKNVMILGGGGTGKTAYALAEEEGARSISVVTRGGALNYSNYREQKDTQIVINATPVGMFPQNGEKPISLDFGEIEGVADVIYNPLRTRLVSEAKARGIPAVGGLKMLVAQALFAEEIWLGKTLDRALIEREYAALLRELTNIVLIGMPGSGKSAVARRLSDRPIDTDSLIEAQTGQPIPRLFEEKGERYFRVLEGEVVRAVSAEHGRVIATGGGVILNDSNVESLKQNGVLLWVKRPLEKLSVKGRPLSSKKGVERLFAERKGKYAAAADFEIENGGSFHETIDRIERKLHEYFGD